MPWHVCPCCVGNIPRTLLMLPTWTYAKDDDGIYVNLFVGSTIQVEDVAGTDVEMVQKTDYPWDGKVAITVNPKESKEFAVRIRSPQRSVSTLYTSTPEADGIKSVLVNGTPVKPKLENGYAVIRREWKPGDTIELELPMTPQRVKGSDKVEANRGRVALRYGPLVYNIESVDGNKMDGVLKPDAPLTTEWRPDLLGGVVVIKGQVRRRLADDGDSRTSPATTGSRKHRRRKANDAVAGADAAAANRSCGSATASEVVSPSKMSGILGHA